jgi:hypothetical protein
MIRPPRSEDNPFGGANRRRKSVVQVLVEVPDLFERVG